eukprot:1090590-Rhodomonas_salina.5
MHLLCPDGPCGAASRNRWFDKSFQARASPLPDLSRRVLAAIMARDGLYAAVTCSATPCTPQT